MPQAPFHIMAKPIGPICNLGCKYCFYLEKENLYPNTTKWEMPPDVLREFIQQYIQSQPGDTVSFAWQGGEPTLLGLDFFRNVVDLQSRYANGKTIQNAFQTNGTLLDDDWGDFLKKHDFLVGLSIDGPRQVHDFHRVNKGGSPTFDKVMSGLSFLKKHDVAFNTLTTVTRHNSEYPLEVYQFLKEIGSRFMQFIPVVERATKTPHVNGLTLLEPSPASGAKVTEWSVESRKYGVFLAKIFDEWVRHDVGQYYVQHFDVALASWMGLDGGLCVFGKTCGTALVLEHTGDLYSCDHFVYPDHKLGNIMTVPIEKMASSAQQQTFGNNKSDTLPRVCIDCSVKFACHGECPKHRFLKSPSGETGLNYLCAGYKYFFNHIDRHMQFMADELQAGRPPANIMRMLANQDQRCAPAPIPRRNDPCSCGSGKKAKKCCFTS